MTKGILAIIIGVVLAGTVGLTVMATVGESGSAGGNLLGQMQRLGNHLHGSGHHREFMDGLADKLQLTTDQRRRLERSREIIAEFHGEGSGSMLELHEKLVVQFEQGGVEAEDLRRVIDGHVERIRVMAYAVTDQMIALIDELDARQRRILLEHLEGADRESHDDGI